MVTSRRLDGISKPLRAYAELHCLSNFTFLRGASHPDELVQQAIKLGYQALAITDECTLSGIVRAHIAAKQARLKLIVGSEFQLSDGPKLVLLATNREGYAELSALITKARSRAEKGQYQIFKADLSKKLSHCLCLLIPSLTPITDIAQWITDQQSTIYWLKTCFPSRFWIAVEALYLSEEKQRIKALQQLGQQTNTPMVASGDVHMHCRGRRALQDVLTAIRHNTTVADAGMALYSNGERHLRSYEQLSNLYEPAWLQATIEIADRCDFSLDALRYEYPDDLVPDGATATHYLRELTEEGIRHYWPNGISDKLRAQIEHELKLIAELQYEPFFLTVHDLVRFARSQGILCQGRGSAANSAVCYCLHITAVDPARSNMLFERFISKERDEPPDIDVDFENARREEVMQYIYNKYGRHRAALAATVICYRRKSALRDAGKALGLSLAQVNRITRSLIWWIKDISNEQLREAGLEPDNPIIKRLLILAKTLLGFPRHLSQHVGGFVIARDQLSRLVPVENAAMPDRTIIQWDKNDLEALGLLKVDCLALGMLSAISRCFQLIKQHNNLNLTLDNIPADDPTTYQTIQHADTVGLFQIESRAQMNMLPRLKPKTFYDLVIQIAIVRPGPIQGDMVHPYLRRRRGEEPVTYPGKEVQSVLSRTLGVPIFQEQVIELAMVAAGFSGGEADQLRRAIGAWRSTTQLESFRDKLINGMLKRNYEPQFAEQVFNQIRGFGEYGFPESHSASFALIAYVSAWLKTHHPAAFTCALLNSQPMGFYAPSQLVQDVQRHQVTVLPADVTNSNWTSSLEQSHGQLAIRLGLHQIKGLGKKTGQQIATARLNRPFQHVQDLQSRIQLSKKESQVLAAADALKSLAGHRHQASWQALDNQVMNSSTDLLNSISAKPATAVVLSPPTEAENIIADYAHTRLSLRRHPIALLRPLFDKKGWFSSKRLWQCPNNSMTRVAGLTISRQHPAAKGTIFITLEDEFGTINIVIWSRVTALFTKAVVHGRLLMVEGKVERDGRVIHVIADTVYDHTELLGELDTSSRDFH